MAATATATAAAVVERGKAVREERTSGGSLWWVSRVSRAVCRVAVVSCSSGIVSRVSSSHDDDVFLVLTMSDVRSSRRSRSPHRRRRCRRRRRHLSRFARGPVGQTARQGYQRTLVVRCRRSRRRVFSAPLNLTIASSTGGRSFFRVRVSRYVSCVCARRGKLQRVE